MCILFFFAEFIVTVFNATDKNIILIYIKFIYYFNFQ